MVVVSALAERPHLSRRYTCRECDVLPALEYRYYYRFASSVDQELRKGYLFLFYRWHPNSEFFQNNIVIIVLLSIKPPIHGSSQRFDLTRICETVRSTEGQFRDGVAPSYFIEGLLYNVPDVNFGTNFDNTFVKTFNYLVAADRSIIQQSNGIHMLLGASAISWQPADCQAYIDALRQLWNNWR